MSRSSLASIRDLARGAALDVAWAQWSCLSHTVAATNTRPVVSIVDVEALVLLSLVLRDDERRLLDVLAALAKRDSKLLSVHRMQHVGARFPDVVMPHLHEFASWAKHPSWMKLGKRASTDDRSPPRSKDLGPLRLLNPPTLQLRLRAAFGVGLKSDLLCYLIGQQSAGASVADLSNALGYTERNVRAAADDLAGAGLVGRDDYSPQTAYMLPLAPWRALLATDDAPVANASWPARWVNWADLFAFLANVIELAHRADDRWTDYVIESRARDLVETHYPRLIRGRALSWNGQMARESRGLDALERIVSDSVGSMRDTL
jgi:hypothetical protein